jgi:hypothetical protein
MKVIVLCLAVLEYKQIYYLKMPYQGVILLLSLYTTNEVGLPTLNDIITELSKPGRDPRTGVVKMEFSEDIQTIEDLKIGMILPGIVTNITNLLYKASNLITLVNNKMIKPITSIIFKTLAIKDILIAKGITYIDLIEASPFSSCSLLFVKSSFDIINLLA